ncbi:MAG: NfeD family protein [Pseudomonadales bacterium]|nr:NfeD family protein [Pseudomonadales bacterium]MCP5215911.1 NfeD family protein [Pseudomonadales bacterium]
MPWWGWVIFGVLLLGSELFVVDVAFYLVFIGIAAAITGLVGLAGIELALWGQWLLFAALAIISMVLFRERLYQKIRGGGVDYKSGPAGEHIRLEETIAPGDTCRLTYRGTTWTVLNNGSEIIEKGQTAEIKKVEGLTLVLNNSETIN